MDLPIGRAVEKSHLTTVLLLSAGSLSASTNEEKRGNEQRG